MKRTLAIFGGLGIFAVVAVIGLRARGPSTVTGMPTPRFSSPECEATYRKVFAAPAFEIRVAYGYKDARPARFVADRYERMMLVDRVVGKCADADSVCGFARDPRDPDRFTKTIAGPDGAPRTVRLLITAPSVGADDVENRRDPLQSKRSAEREREFLASLSEADVVLYNGHSRAGGGPDFHPPRLRGGSVDYGWYRKNIPGLRAVLAATPGKGSANERPRLVGFLSCASTKHFLAKVAKRRPGLATLSSPELLYFSDAHDASVDFLSSLLEMRCAPAFRTNGAARLIGWFASRPGA